MKSDTETRGRGDAARKELPAQPLPFSPRLRVAHSPRRSSCLLFLAFRLLVPAVRAPPVQCFALGGRVIHRFTHAPRDHPFLFAEFVPAAQLAFATARASSLELIIYHRAFVGQAFLPVKRATARSLSIPKHYSRLQRSQTGRNACPTMVGMPAALRFEDRSRSAVISPVFSLASQPVIESCQPA
jgi:hypothetical protein